MDKNPWAIKYTIENIGIVDMGKVWAVTREGKQIKLYPDHCCEKAFILSYETEEAAIAEINKIIAGLSQKN